MRPELTPEAVGVLWLVNQKPRRTAAATVAGCVSGMSARWLERRGLVNRTLLSELCVGDRIVYLVTITDLGRAELEKRGRLPR